MCLELDTKIEMAEIKSAIRDLKRSKSGGLLVNELFMYDDSYLQPYILKLFDFVFQSGVSRIMVRGLTLPIA